MVLGRLPEGRLLDAVLVVLAVLGEVEIWIGSAAEPKFAAGSGALIATLPLLLRRRLPLGAPVFVFAGTAALAAARPEALREGASTTFFALLLAFWIVGADNEQHRVVAGGAVGLAALAVLSGRAATEEPRADPLFPGGVVRMGVFDAYVVVFFALGAGLSIAAYALQWRARRASALEARAARLEREREEEAHIAVAAERLRIARDLHNVIVHGVSVMTIQAGAARLLLEEEPRRAREPLLSVEEAGRETLAETRRLLGILRTEEDEASLAPRPGLASLTELVAQVRRTDLPVELVVAGEPRALPTGVELAAYRIAQEALTHALEHDRAASARLDLRYGSDVLELELTTDGPDVFRNGDSDGHWLLGMRERVALYRGELDAGPRPGGGYAVRARFPVELDAPAFASPPLPASVLHERASKTESRSAGHESRIWAPLQRHLFDALVVVLAVVSEIEIWITSVPGPTVVLVPSVLLWTLPLLWRRRFPFAAPACVFAVQAISAFAGEAVGGAVTAAAPLFLAFWTLGAHNERKQAVAGVLLGAASIVVVADRDARLAADEATSAIVIFGALSLVAFVLRRRASRAGALEKKATHLEREREDRARAAVAAERRRVARDLHDVIAHSVSVMTIQAGAARLLLAEEPQRACEPLVSVEETGRQTLTEMRRLLGILRVDEAEVALAPRPGLAALGGLLAQVRTAGLPVEFAVAGPPRALPPGVELAAYRIVQEALTNARKHCTPVGAGVALRYGRDALEVEITNEGRYVARADGGGHGLVGMRERVALYGGVLEAGPRAEGGYRVRARLPIEPAQT